MLGHQLFRRQVQQLLNDFDSGIFDWSNDPSEHLVTCLQSHNDPFLTDIDTLQLTQRQKNRRRRQQEQQQQQQEQQTKPASGAERLAAYSSSSSSSSSGINEEINMSVWDTIKPIKLDLIEKDKEYIIHADLPGIKKEDVKLSVKDDILTINAEKKKEKEKEKEKEQKCSTAICKRTERLSWGKFSRSIKLPRDVLQNKISASQDNGVLTVVLPKSDVAIVAHLIAVK